MKKLIPLCLSVVLICTCISCSTKKGQTQEPQISQMRSICELSVMECYYHNVAKFLEKDASGFLFWHKDKHFWIEYSGVVRLGIDASLLSLEVDGTSVSITLPEAKILSCTVDSSSLSEDSFIVDQGSAPITADDQTFAFSEAQLRMEKQAANDKVLLINAQQQVQTLLEKYINNIGDMIGVEYAIHWNYLSNASPSNASPSPEPSVPTEVTPS